MIETAVVILNWNGQKFLERFLPGVIRHSAGLADVIVADNASTDGSVKWMQEQHPGIRVILNSENGGFARGYNDALKDLDYKYFLLLNSDIEVGEGWLRPLIDRITSDERIFAVQPTLRAYDNPSHFEYAGAAGGYLDSLGYPFCRGRLFEVTEEDKGQYDESADIFWATGACMLVRAATFRELAGFDAHFFAHMEEIDLCWRALSAGYRNVHEPASHVLHIGGGTLPKRSSRKTYLNFRNNLFLLYKNLPFGNFLSIYFPRLVLDAVAALKFMAGGGIQDAFMVIKAHTHFWCQRHKVQVPVLKSRLSAHGTVLRGSIVIARYMRGIKEFSGLRMPGKD